MKTDLRQVEITSDQKLLTASRQTTGLPDPTLNFKTLKIGGWNFFNVLHTHTHTHTHTYTFHRSKAKSASHTQVFHRSKAKRAPLTYTHTHTYTQIFHRSKAKSLCFQASP